MSGGSHRSKNPRGSPTGRKGRGDIQAQKKKGRKRMYNQERKKGPVQVKKIEEPVEFKEWTDSKVELIMFLFCRNKFSPPGLLWDDILRELKLSKIKPEKAHDFLIDLEDTAHPWLVYQEKYSIYLKHEHFDEIKAFTVKELKKHME